MSEKCDAIVVGAGPAGATAATVLARAGLEVVLIERGPYPGSKNVSGGVIYAQVCAPVFPAFWESAPVERAIRGHSLVVLGDSDSVALEHVSGRESETTPKGFSVLRGKFDPWMASQAEAAGASLVSGVNVDELVTEQGRVLGVKAGTDTLLADVVVVADGARSLLLRQAGMCAEPSPRQVSLGVKEVIRLPEGEIDRRFHCRPGVGAAYTLLGHTGGVEGGGFLYTNKDSISLGVVVKVESLASSGRQPHEILDEFKAHPFVERLVDGGEVVEYSAQMVHRGGLGSIPKLYGDGYIVVGSAAHLLLNNVWTLRGMDLAVASGAAGARAVLEAKASGDLSGRGLSRYESLWRESSAYKDMVAFERAQSVLDNPRLFHAYPELACSVLGDLTRVSSVPARKAWTSLKERAKGSVSLPELARDLWHMARAL